METCKLAFKLPARDEVLQHPYTLPTSDTLQLEICKLDAPRPLHVGSLSWRLRPPCIETQNIVAIVGEVVESGPFHCKSGSIIAYEVSCSRRSLDTKACEADIWSSHHETWGKWPCSTAFYWYWRLCISSRIFCAPVSESRLDSL